MPAQRDRGPDKIRVWAGLTASLQQRSEVRHELFVRETWKPRIVQHDEVVGARPRFEIYQFFLKKI
jgi:hypothetical protein